MTQVVLSYILHLVEAMEVFTVVFSDLSTPDAHLTPFYDSANLSFPYVDNNSLNQVAQEVAQLKLEKQQLQQQQHIFHQQLLLFLQLQRMLQKGNISQPPQQPALQLTQQSMPQLTPQPTS